MLDTERSSERNVMPIRIYRLSSTQTNTAVGQATTVCIAKGRIKQVVMTSTVTPNGATAGRHSYEVALNNTANGNAESASGAPSQQLVARQSHSWPAGAGAAPVAALNTHEHENATPQRRWFT